MLRRIPDVITKLEFVNVPDLKIWPGNSGQSMFNYLNFI